MRSKFENTRENLHFFSYKMGPNADALKRRQGADIWHEGILHFNTSASENTKGNLLLTVLTRF